MVGIIEILDASQWPYRLEKTNGKGDWVEVGAYPTFRDVFKHLSDVTPRNFLRIVKDGVMVWPEETSSSLGG